MNEWIFLHLLSVPPNSAFLLHLPPSLPSLALCQRSEPVVRGSRCHAPTRVRDTQLGRRGQGRAPPAQSCANEGPGCREALRLCRPWFNWSNEMQRILGEVRYHRPSRTKQGEGAYCWALWVRKRKRLLSRPEFVELFLVKDIREWCRKPRFWGSKRV